MKRCLNDLKKGDIYDGAFAASYNKERLEFGVYPTTDSTIRGSPDEKKRIHTSQYSLYILKSNKQVTWDGKKMNGAKIIASLPAHSIIDFLTKMKITVDDGTRLPLNVFEKLIANRFDAVAIQDSRADNILNTNLELGKKIKKISPPLEKKLTI